MMKIVEENEVAKRKPYKFSYETTRKMEIKRQEKEMKKIKIATGIFKINSLVDAM